MASEDRDITLFLQTWDYIVPKNTKDFISYYEQYTPTRISNYTIVMLYELLVDIGGGCPYKCFLRETKQKYYIQENIDEKIYGARDEDVYHAVCHSLVPEMKKIQHNYIPLRLPQKEETIVVHKNDTISYDKNTNTLYFTNPQVLSVLLATVFPQTKHLKCINYFLISKYDYALDMIDPQRFSHRFRNTDSIFKIMSDNTNYPECMVNGIEKCNTLFDIDCMERFGKLILELTESRRKKLEERGSLSYYTYEEKCSVCLNEMKELMSYTCCNATICWKCHMEWMTMTPKEGEMKCIKCRQNVKCMKKVIDNGTTM